MKNLKDCPFCGSEKVGVDREYDCDTSGTFYSIKCDKCSASSRKSYASRGDDCPVFYAGVANDWNRRIGNE